MYPRNSAFKTGMLSVCCAGTGLPQYGHFSARLAILSFLFPALSPIILTRDTLRGAANPTPGRVPARLHRDGGGARNSPASAKILCLLRFRGHAPQFRRRLPPLPLALITALAVFLLPEEQPVHELAGPRSHPVPRPTVTARGQGFIRPAAEERIDELVDGDQYCLAPVHAAPGMMMLTTTARTSSTVCAASSRSSRACRWPMM